MENKINRNALVDLSRGISALFIVLYHYTIRYNDNPGIETIKWPFEVPWGCAAVSLFFILTGYYTTTILNSNGLGNNNSFSFIIKKAVRLYPSYIVCVIISSLVTFFYFPWCRISLCDILPNLTMFPWLFSSPSVDGAYWFLRYEWFFIFFIALLLLLPNFQLRRYLILAWGLLSCVLWNLSLSIDNPILNRLIFFFIADHAQEFLFGIALWDILHNKRDVISVICLLIAINSQIINYDLYHILFMILTGCLIIASEKLVRPFVLPKPLKMLSSISYTVYLLHQMVGFTIIYHLNSFVNSSTIILSVTMLIIIISSWFIYAAVESPVLSIYKKYSCK